MKLMKKCSLVILLAMLVLSMTVPALAAGGGGVGPVAPAVMKGRSMAVLVAPDSSIFAFSAAAFRRCAAILS